MSSLPLVRLVHIERNIDVTLLSLQRGKTRIFIAHRVFKTFMYRARIYFSLRWSCTRSTTLSFFSFPELAKHREVMRLMSRSKSNMSRSATDKPWRSENRSPRNTILHNARFQLTPFKNSYKRKRNREKKNLKITKNILKHFSFRISINIRGQKYSVFFFFDVISRESQASFCRFGQVIIYRRSARIIAIDIKIAQSCCNSC